MQMKQVVRMERAIVLLCQPPEGSASCLPPKEAALVLLATLDALLAALSECCGSLQGEVSAEMAHAVSAAQYCAEDIKELLRQHPELKPCIAASEVDGERVLRWFQCLEGPGGRAAVEVLSLLLAAITADGEETAPGSLNLTPCQASKVRLVGHVVAAGTAALCKNMDCHKVYE
jgi:hypothetical protein